MSDPTQVSYVPQPKKSRRLKKWLVIIAVVALAGAAVGAGYWVFWGGSVAGEASELTESERAMINGQAQDSEILKQDEAEVASKGKQEQVDYFTTKANLASANGEYDEAIGNYNKVLGLQEVQDYTFYINLGLAYELNGDKEQAFQTYSKAKELAEQADLQEKESIISAIDMSIEAVR